MNRNTLDKNIDPKIANLRQNYTKGGLTKADIPENPVDFLRKWIDEAISAEVMEPNAISLATVSPDGFPNTRFVLLKGIDEHSVYFFTNYKSQKGLELQKTPKAAVAIWWPELERQIRFRGGVVKTSREKSENYFHSRPKESRIGAWVSNQSSPVESREKLQEKYNRIEKRFADKEIPKPEHWGGFKITIQEIEFWQGRTGRLHDRIKCTKINDHWNKERLQP